MSAGRFERSSVRRNRRQKAFGLLSLTCSLVTLVLYTAFAFLHDAHAPLNVQWPVLAASIISMCGALLAIAAGMQITKGR